MVARRITLLFFALALLCTTSIPVVHADGTAPGQGEGKKIHPWDNNDDYDIGEDPFTVFRRPVIWIIEIYSGRGAVTWSSQTAGRSLMKMERTNRAESIRSSRIEARWRRVSSK